MPTRINQAVWLEKYQRWQVKEQVDGKRKTFTSTTPGPAGKKECHKKADEWLQNQLVGESTRVEKMFEKWLKELKATTSEGNWTQIESNWKNWVKPEFGAKKIGKVNAQDLKNVITAAHKKGLSKKSLMNIRNCMTAFIKYCRINNCTRLFPEGLTIPNGAPESNKKPIQPSELHVLFHNSKTLRKGKVQDDWFIHAYRFIVATGIRPGELRGLERVKITGNTLQINRAINKFNKTTPGKNRRATRTIKIGVIAQKIWEHQQNMLKQAGIVSKYAFPAEDGNYVTLVTLEKRWEKYRLHNGMAKTTPYEMRHTFVSLNKDMPEALKKLLLGHSVSMDTDGTYSHEMEGDLERAAQMVDAALTAVIGEWK